MKTARRAARRATRHAIIVATLAATALATSTPFAPAHAEPDARTGVVISALHYFGYDGSNDEAIELTNTSGAPVALDGNWTLRDASNHVWPLTPYALNAGQRIWIANNAASFGQQFGLSPTLVYSGALSFANHGGSLALEKTAPDLRDTLDMSGGWAAGKASPAYQSMERIDAGTPADGANWAGAAPSAPIAFDGGGNPITGTPGAPNSVAVGPTSPSTFTVVINEVAWAGTKASSTHEWLELHNTLNASVVLTGWQLSIGNTVVDLKGSIAPNGYFVLARNAATFGSGAAVDQLASFSLSNSGASLRLTDPHAELVDVVVYGDGAPQAGWIGAPVQPYTVTQTIPDDGQLLMRRLDPASALPVADTDAALDWYSDRANPLDGRKPIYPGWRMAQFVAPASGSGALTIAAAPDASFELVAQTLSSATSAIDMESFTFENARLGDLLSAKAAAGVAVRVLLDGSPVGGLSDQTRWICQHITQADATGRSGCWFIRSDAADKVHARYAFLHAKFALIDNVRLLTGSENYGPRGMPFDDKADGTAGQRGVVAVTDAAALVARARAVFDADLDVNQRDITRWCGSCQPYGGPPATFVVDDTSGGTTYTVRFAALAVPTPVSMTLLTSPESNLSSGGLLAVLNAAGAGDEILIEQLDEPHYWGGPGSNPADDPNPRVRALVNAASRGARVRVLLDLFYDDGAITRSNAATVAYLNALAAANGWDLQARRGNPTALGIHNKMFLAKVGGRAFAHIGSWNGTEVSAKRDREMSLLIESAEANAYLSGMFRADWFLSQPVFMPVILRDYAPPSHLLISEVLVNPSGADETGREWIEIYNPTGAAISLSGYKIGDAAVRGSTGEGMFAFPDSAIVAPGKTVVVAENAVAFFADWGLKPDYELADYDPAVPQLNMYAAWAQGNINLANIGDEVVMLDKTDTIVDSVVWGTGVVPGTQPYTGLVSPGHTLQRWPAAADSDNCALDLRDQSVPSPSKTP